MAGKTIKAIIFDCFGVLTTDSWRAFVDSLPPGPNVEAARKVHRKYAAGLISHEDCMQRIKELTGRIPQHVESLLGDEIAKNVPLLDYIGTLKKDYAIGLLSNVATNWVRDTFLTVEEQDLFDAMVFSFEVGVTKPDPLIFTVMIERLRVVPTECVLIDDTERYCEAARAMDMQAIVYKDFQSMKKELQQLIGA